MGKNFLAQIKCAFVDMEGYYTVLELGDGGDLYNFIKMPNYFPTLEIWSFIATNLLMGLDQLHSVRIQYK